MPGISNVRQRRRRPRVPMGIECKARGGLDYCARWVFGQGHAQNGIAFRIRPDSGGWDSVVLERNVYLQGFWLRLVVYFHSGRNFGTAKAGTLLDDEGARGSSANAWRRWPRRPVRSVPPRSPVPSRRRGRPPALQLVPEPPRQTLRYRQGTVPPLRGFERWMAPPQPGAVPSMQSALPLSWWFQGPSSETAMRSTRCAMTCCRTSKS